MADKLILWNDYIKKNIGKALALAYGIGALLAVLYMGVNFVCSAKYQKRELTVLDFETVDCEFVSDAEIVTETEDSQMIYTGNLVNMYVKCSFSQPEGEFLAFYAKNENHSFGINRVSYAKLSGDWYVFHFPYGTKQVRVDPGVTVSNTVHFDEIIVNNNTPKERFRYSNSLLFTVFAGSPVALVVFSTAAEILDKRRKR